MVWFEPISWMKGTAVESKKLDSFQRCKAGGQMKMGIGWEWGGENQG